MQRSPSRDNQNTIRTMRAGLGTFILTAALTAACNLLCALTLDLTPSSAGAIGEVPAVPLGAHAVAIEVTGCPRLTVRSIIVRGLVVAWPTDVAVVVYDGRTGEVVAAGEAIVAPGRDVPVSVPISATLEGEAPYGVLIGYGDGVSAYGLLDPDPAGEGGFPYTAGGGMVRVLEVRFSSPVILAIPNLLLPLLSLNVLPCSEEERFRRGDANSDGEVDLSDAISTLDALFAGRGVFRCEDAADANDDGDIDISDVVATLVGLFVGTAEIPDPGPLACGRDPTEDGLSCGEYEACEPSPESSTIVNGVLVGAGAIRALEDDYGILVLPGDYWYDKVCGAYGLRGGPTMGFIFAGLDIGGPLPADASAGDTGVFINGRVLPRTELDALELVLGMIPAGRYWLDSRGDYGYEGEPAAGNLVTAFLAARGQGNQNGYLERTYFGSIGSDGQTSYFFDSSTGCSVISGGGVSC